MSDRQDRITDFIELVLDAIDPLLGPDLSVSTKDHGDHWELTIHAVIEAPA